MRSSLISLVLAPLPPLLDTMLTIETIIMIGKSMNIGLRIMPPPAPPPKLPEVTKKAIMPTIATTMTSGMILAMMGDGTGRGISGGGCTLTSPPGTRGTASRGRRIKIVVFTRCSPLALRFPRVTSRGYLKHPRYRPAHGGLQDRVVMFAAATNSITRSPPPLVIRLTAARMRRTAGGV
ncbi:Uncharacterised protein [Mycobacteroides abscessus subsp. abscessus]|nr:Uncharacterised protein [Mycobacteroides abscessus subsp. abscessus]